MASTHALGHLGLTPNPRRSTRGYALLRAFQRDGYYLIDASDKPIPEDASSVDRSSILGTSLPTLSASAARLSKGYQRLPFVLISTTVYDVCRDALVANGINVLNREAIDFPLGNWQDRFHERMRRLLRGKHEPRDSGAFS